jgi:hypothetical protein
MCRRRGKADMRRTRRPPSSSIASRVWKRMT